jgi:hypothetical protein
MNAVYGGDNREEIRIWGDVLGRGGVGGAGPYCESLVGWNCGEQGEDR